MPGFLDRHGVSGSAGACRHRSLIGALAGVLCLFAASCDQEEAHYTEVKRIDDRLTQAELDSFLSVAKSMPENALSALTAIHAPWPEWSPNRTLPINELVVEEKKQLALHCSVKWLSQRISQSRAFKRALRREQMTIDQFVGLAFVIGVTLCHDELPEDQDIDKLRTHGKRVIAALERETRVLSSLPEDNAARIIVQAGWIPLVDRLERLKQVLPENLVLVRANRDALKSLFPEDFLKNPLRGLAKVLEDEEIPFEELPESGSDNHLQWSREQAIAGEVAPVSPSAGQ